ncbi:class A sortase [Aerococcaceae bacterium NML190073]|nr:class A sortase [Aerococcaceae bacterium NML190073]
MRKHKSRNRRNFIRYLIAGLLFCMGIGLLLLDPLKNYFIQQGQEVNSIVNLTREEIVANQQRTVTYNFEDVEAISAYRVLKNRINPKDLPTIGAIAIPSVKVNLPIYLGVSEEGMYLGACTLIKNQQMGQSNYPLASHHSIHPDLLFAPLKHLQLDDLIYLTDLDAVYVYRTHLIETVDPYRMDVLASTEQSIVTLITCDDTLENRLIIQAELIDTKPMKQVTPEMLDAFNLAQTVPE